MNKAKPKVIKHCNRLDLESVGSGPTMPKNFPGTGRYNNCISQSISLTFSVTLTRIDWALDRAVDVKQCQSKSAVSLDTWHTKQVAAQVLLKWGTYSRKGGRNGRHLEKLQVSDTKDFSSYEVLALCKRARGNCRSHVNLHPTYITALKSYAVWRLLFLVNLTTLVNFKIYRISLPKTIWDETATNL